jgi:hypothetical protein
MIIRSTRRHGITLVRLSVETGLPTIWSTGIVACTILLVLIHVRSIIGARIVRMAVGVVATLRLLGMTWLGLSALGCSRLLALGSWVRGGVTASLTLSGCGIP